MAIVVSITNINSGKIYNFFTSEVPTLSWNFQSRVFKEPLPDDDGDKAIIIDLGANKEWRFPFKMLDTGAESADPTGSIFTPAQKQAYLRDDFLSFGIEDLYTATFTTLHGTISSIKGILESVQITFDGNNPKSLNGSLTLSVGGGSQ